MHGHPLTYLDNAATTHKPWPVLEAMQDFYVHSNSNVHRGIHTLGERATAAYEEARAVVAAFLNADVEECIFVKGTTEGINLVAQTFGERHLAAGDEVLISGLEHHANWVPWQLVTERKGAVLKVMPLNAQGNWDWERSSEWFSERTRLVAVTMASNVLGSIQDYERLIKEAHARSIPVLLDAAQYVVHRPVDVRALDADFLVFSGHKMYGPTGIGVLYGKRSWLEQLPPYQSGGHMIEQVSLEKTTFKSAPYKFEAGTPPVAEAIGLGAALRFLSAQDRKAIQAEEERLLRVFWEGLSHFRHVRLYGQPDQNVGVISWVHDAIHPHDLATGLDRYGIAIRAGHHCAMPLMRFFGVPAMARLSIALYNTDEDWDRFEKALLHLESFFGCRS